MVSLIWFAVGRNRKRRKDAEAREQIKQQLITAESEISDLDNAVLTNSETDVSAESTKANASLYDARKAYETGDYGAARAHLKVVESTVAKANQKLYPGRPAPTSPPSTRCRGRPQAGLGAGQESRHRRVRDDQQQQLQHHPTARLSALLRGGYYNGMFFYPGYYPYAFWGRAGAGRSPTSC